MLSVREGLHILSRGAPSWGAKLCTYIGTYYIIHLQWFARPDRVSTEPCYELPLPLTKLRSIFHFRTGAHSWPIEQGRIEMPQVPRHLRRCTFWAGTAIGDERHCVFDCPHFQGLGSSMHGFSRILMMPWGPSCGTRTRNLFVLLCWPLSMRSRQHDRFVLVGVCWLYGSSESPPPPPLCRLSRAGFNVTCPRCHDICAGARFVPPWQVVSFKSNCPRFHVLISRTYRTAAEPQQQRVSGILTMP